jgi:hypothetical protein
VVEGKVIAINPSDSTVDVALFGGQILRRVSVLQSTANTIAGFRYLASVANTDAAQKTDNGVVDKALLTHKSDTIATIVYVQGQALAPRVIGFTFPTDSQMHLDEQGLSIFRHESGVYSLIDKTGHQETHYPDGSYIIASSESTPAPKTIKSGKSAQKWKTPSNAPNVNIAIHLASGVDITIKDGKVTMTATQVDIVANTVNLGGAGGASIARVGDPVSVNTTTGVGTITSGSSKVKST